MQFCIFFIKLLTGGGIVRYSEVMKRFMKILLIVAMVLNVGFYSHVLAYHNENNVFLS